jgi:hypothetical protein
MPPNPNSAADCESPRAAASEPMDGEASDGDIARIEERIEELRDAIARCRKLSAAAKLLIGAGAAWLALTVVWLIPYVPYMVIAAMAAVIGGIVLLGSNSTTWAQMQAALADSEDMRAASMEGKQARSAEGIETIH